jgi:DUF1680 family protein
LYNALNGSLALDGTRFYYTNPLDANAQRTTWHSCPCCVGNLSRTMLMIPTWMYSKGVNAIHVNLFVGSRVTVPAIAGTDVELTQTTNYPWDGNVSIAVNPSSPKTFAIKIRVPERDVSELYRAEPKADGITVLRVNGRAVTPTVVNGYAVIERAWKKGDTIDFELPMPVQRVYASDKVAADAGKVALRVGPLVYNIEQVDQDIHATLDPKAPLKTEWRGDLLHGVNVVTGRFADGSAMTAIPNYARYNRNPIAPQVAPAPAPPPATSIVWIKE